MPESRSPPPGPPEGFDIRAARDAQDAVGPLNARGPLPHAESLHALDWLNFFLAALLMGFGPFVAVKLHDRPERAEQLPLPLVSVPRARLAAMGGTTQEWRSTVLPRYGPAALGKWRR